MKSAANRTYSLISCILLYLAIISFACRADLNSGTYDDEEASLDSLTRGSFVQQSDEIINNQPKMSGQASREQLGRLQIGITKKAEGCKRQAQKGDSLHMHYRGTLKDGGVEFDSSYNRGQPLVFTLGVGQVIKGWDQGLLGICVGEKRKLVIPPHLAYGEMGSPPTIPPQATLIFEVEAVNIVPADRKDL